MCRQSVDEPWRTISALVNAAKDMQIAAIPTQMALLEAGGEYCCATRGSPLAGTRFCPPPPPVYPAGRSGRGKISALGGGNVVAMVSRASLLSLAKSRRLIALRSGQRLLRRVLHDVVRARGSLDAVLIGIVIHNGIFAAEIIPRRGRRHDPFERSAFPGIGRRGRSAEAAVDQVIDEQQLHQAGENGGHGDELMQRNERLQEIVGEGGVAAYVSSPPQIVEGHEDAVSSHEGEPEMIFADGFIHHAPEHLGEPEV